MKYSKRKYSQQRNSSGFTLIEMIVATMVLAIGVVGAIAAFNIATKASRKASDLQTATLIAEAQLNNTQVQQALQGTLTGGDSEGDSEDYPGFHWKQTIDSTDYTTNFYLYQVSVTVTWGDRTRPDSKTISTYMVSNQNAQNGTSTTTTGGGTGG